jgi:cytochrome P450
MHFTMVIQSRQSGEHELTDKLAKSHTWINIMLNSAYLGFLGTIWRRLPWLKIIIPWILPPNAVENRKTHIKLCTERARSRLKAKNDRDDFFGHLIAKNANNVTEGFLASQAVSLIIGGSETTATALAGITYNILTNREILDKLTAEVRSAFNSATEITGDSAAKLPYLSAVIEEGLRIFPPVAVGLPRTSPGALVDGHYIPAGVTVFTPTYVMHHDARFWRNPEDFIPERWIPGNGYDNDNHDAFKPMSLGPRNCIGQSLAYIELRIAVARLVYHYDLQLCNGADIDWKRDVRSMALWKMPQVMVRVKSANRA